MSYPGFTGLAVSIGTIKMDSALFQTILIAAAIGAASGSIGAFIILRKMALVGDALSHVALPGIALALIYGFDPFWGVLVFLAAAAFMVWWLEEKTRIPSDAIVGLLFTSSLAIGILFIPDTEILESLFGSFPGFSPPIFLVMAGTAVTIAVLAFFLSDRFALAAVSPELSLVHKSGRMDDLKLFLLFSLVVALGIKLVGTLLMGALTIIPASIAKNVCKSMKGYLTFAAFLGGAISVAGVIISKYFGFLPGPTIILLGVVIFLASLFFVRK